MNTEFIESKLNPHFAQDQINTIKKLINGSNSFTLSGMPGVGGSIFLRFLSLQDFAHFIYIDTYQLADITRLSYYQLLLKELNEQNIPDNEQAVLESCRQTLRKLVKIYPRVVIILNRFDQLKNYFSNQLFADLMSLRDINREKILFVFTASKPYIKILPSNISADKMNLFSQTVYLKPYSENDLRQLLNISSNATIHTPEFITKAIFLCGGHYQLLQLFLKSERLEPPFIDQFVKFQLKEIYDNLSYQQKKQVKKIAQGKKVSQIDDYLPGVGLVKQIGPKFELFSPVFSEYIRQNQTPKMSLKENRLFRLLRDNLGKLVTKDQIFQTIWSEDPENATDWALSSLLYRLRKHPTLSNQNLIIESYKKQGYILIKD